MRKYGMIKVITDKKGYILGAHVLGAEGGEIIQGFLIAKSLKITLPKITRALFIYPTLSELVKKTAAQPLLETMNKPMAKFIIGRMRR